MRTSIRPHAARGRLVRAAIAALAVLGLATGCAVGAADSGGTAADPAPQLEYVPEEREADQGLAPADPSAPTMPEERLVVVQTAIALRSGDVPGTAEQVESTAGAFGGYVEARDEQTGYSRPTASVTIRVPAQQHDALLEELRTLADVVSVSTSATDVTLATTDLNGRIEGLESSIKSLRTMLEQATKVSDMLEIERELSTRESELLGLQRQRDWLVDQAAMSTITVTITADASTIVDPDDDVPGFLTGLKNGWNDMVVFITGAIGVIGYLLPTIGLALVLAAIVWAFAASAARRRRRHEPAAEDTAEDAETEDASEDAPELDTAPGRPEQG